MNWTNEAGEEVSTSVAFVPEKVNGLNVAATYTANFAEDAGIRIIYNRNPISGGYLSKYMDDNIAPVTGTVTGSVATANPG